MPRPLSHFPIQNDDDRDRKVLHMMSNAKFFDNVKRKKYIMACA